MTLTAALQEAYTSIPTGTIILPTLELYRPSYVDEFGNPAAARIVADHADHDLTLEPTAILHGGQTVTFTKLNFRFTPPQVRENQIPEMRVEIDNIGKDIMRYVDAATDSEEEITATFREYLSTDTSGPAHQFSAPLRNIRADPLVIRGTMKLANFLNMRFPRSLYTPSSHPGLVK